MKRRDAIGSMMLGIGGLATATTFLEKDLKPEYKGKINHSVCRWCYSGIPDEEFIAGVKQIPGLKSIEITTAKEWPALIKNGLTAAVGTIPSASISNGFNDPKNHESLQKSFHEVIDQAAEYGIPNVIVFSGNRRGMDDMVGMENCAVGLDPLAKHAEKKGVTIIMELLNSKVDHKDYMCDKTAWGTQLVDKIGSNRFKLLYDIYHMQIMEGDVIATIRNNHQYFGHYHTGGVPGRNEIDETQELYYPAIMKAIVETGYTGYVGQEFRPTWEDKLKALSHGVRTCDI